MASQLWVPGAAGPHDELVERIHRQIERFVAAHPADQALVEVELRDGSRFMLESISPDPGFGFVTLRPHAREGEPPVELIVPVGALARITLGEPSEPETSFGFSLPA